MSRQEEELRDLARRYQKRSQDAYYKYQQTGELRYRRKYESDGDIANGLSIAANASDDREQLAMLREQIADWAEKAQGDNVYGLANEIVRFAVDHGLTMDRRIKHETKDL